MKHTPFWQATMHAQNICSVSLNTCICVPDLVRILAWPDGNWHKKHGSVLPFLRTCAITSQFECLHLWMYLHDLRKNYCACRLLSKISVDKMANQLLCEEMNEQELSLTSSMLRRVRLSEMMAKLLLVNIKWAANINVIYMMLSCDCCEINI